MSEENTDVPAKKKKRFAWFRRNKEVTDNETVSENDVITQQDDLSEDIESPETHDVNLKPAELNLEPSELDLQSSELDLASSEDETPNKNLPNEQPKQSFYKRLKKGLSKTRGQFSNGLANLVLGKKEIDDDSLEEIETLLLMADVGVDTTSRIIDDLTERTARKELQDTEALIAHLKSQLHDILKPVQVPLNTSLKSDSHQPFVILMVGINGVGKTTTIGKMAHQFIGEGKSVMLAAGDTFRAAAVEQLKAWGDRNNVPVVAQHTGADSASVIYDAVEKAKAKNIDVIIADTAGRLHTKSNLMEELAKIKRVVGKIDADAPHEIMLVVDAGTGQNALVQAVEFNKIVKLSSITVTKLDGTAKGGVVFAIADKMKLPIRYIGVGEAKEDLREFNAEDYISALFD
ncbi:MAG: signal recognition particle-docking protein FtsY [Gammaproteobacteria bacterium]|nr:MAG: signal recognition particle-docking protein FtsY [Gammaproteobacteria bacterium]